MIDLYSAEYLLKPFLEYFGAPIQSHRAGAIEPDSVLRIDVECEDPSLAQQIAEVAGSADISKPRALVIGPEGMQSAQANSAVQSLVEHWEHLQCLEGIYLGALEFRHFHENQIVDIGELLEKYQGIRVFGLHVGYGGWDEEPFSLNRVRHIGLETLLYQSHHDAQNFAANLGRCILPNLKRMILHVQGDYEPGDAYLRALFLNEYPALEHLTIPNSYDADDIASLIAASPLLGQLESLDLSGGWLTDDGALALRDAPGIASLKELAIHQHYVSEEVISGLQSLPLTLNQTPVAPDDEYWEQVKRNRITRRIRPHAGEEYIIRLDCLPHHDLSVLSEVVIEGKVRFFDDMIEEYLGKVLENPTWLDLALEANRMQRSVGDYHHVFMEDWWVEGPDPELPGVQRGGMSFGS